MKKFTAYTNNLQSYYTYNFHNINEFIFDSFTKKLSLRYVNHVSKLDLFNRSPFMFGVFIDNNKKIDDTVYFELSKINNVLSVHSKNYDYFIYKNLNTDGDHILFRNWINAEGKKNKALTIVEKVNMSTNNFDDYAVKINVNSWYPTLNDFDNYKEKKTLTQILDNKTLIIE